MPSTPVTTVTVINQLGKDLVLYTVTAQTPKDPNNPTPAELVPIYTKVDTVATGAQKTVGFNNVLNRIAICPLSWRTRPASPVQLPTKLHARQHLPSTRDTLRIRTAPMASSSRRL